MRRSQEPRRRNGAAARRSTPTHELLVRDHHLRLRRPAPSGRSLQQPALSRQSLACTALARSILPATAARARAHLAVGESCPACLLVRARRRRAAAVRPRAATTAAAGSIASRTRPNAYEHAGAYRSTSSPGSPSEAAGGTRVPRASARAASAAASPRCAAAGESWLIARATDRASAVGGASLRGPSGPTVTLTASRRDADCSYAPRHWPTRLAKLTAAWHVGSE